MKTVIVCGGGPKSEWLSLERYKSLREVVFIGADRGAIHLLNEGIIPHAAVGDFDSLTTEELTYVTSLVPVVNMSPPIKNETDTDLALVHSLEYNPEQVLLTGVTGGRLDHFMAVLNSMYRFQKDNPSIQFTIQNKLNELSLLSPGVTRIDNRGSFPYVSFFSFQERVKNVTLTGLKYNVHNECIEIGDSRFTSNEVLSDEGSISFTSGICLLIRSSDQ